MSDERRDIYAEQRQAELAKMDAAYQQARSKTVTKDRVWQAGQKLSSGGDEIARAQQFYGSLAARRTTFSPDVESSISKAFSHATMFDIETGGLDPKSPIYEMGFQHGIDSPSYRHAFVKPTDISGQNMVSMSGFTEDLLKARQEASPGIRGAILGSALGQKESALSAYSELSGRDVWVQNLGFERRALNERASKEDFNNWARESKLGSFSPGGGVYTSTPNLKRAIVEANTAGGRMAPLDTYLSKWEGVFGEIDSALRSPRQPGVTRAFDMLDLTRSVFAMAQKRGYMEKTGELFSGTSIDALSRALYDVPELHTALGDAALQGELTRFLYGAGKTMQSNGALGVEAGRFFSRISDVQPVQKQRNLTKNIIDTFKDQQRYLGEKELGNVLPDLLEGSRLDAPTRTYSSKLEVLQSDGSYQTEKFSHVGRDYSRGNYSSDINEVVGAWRARDQQRHGVDLDYDAAMKDALAYIDPYQAKVKELAGDRLAALGAMEGASESLRGKMDGEVAKAFSEGTGQRQSWLKRNWKIGAGVAGGIALAGYLFSGSDDEYNYIEGMRHGGFSGESRKHNTDFGSGWQGLSNSYKGPVASQEVKSYEVEDADTVHLMMNGGNRITLRMAGIDAPEVRHGDHYAAHKVFQDQPYGSEATAVLEDLLAQQTSISMVFDPTGDSTYGRTAGLLVGDNGTNINLELVKMGAAASLPFGSTSERLFSTSEFNAAQERAYEAHEGMWDEPGWRAVYDAQRRSKRKATHNSFTDLRKLYENFKAASITHRLRNPDADFSSMFASGGRDDFNIEEGLRHGWFQSSRQANLGDFGSGYRIDKVIETVRKSTKVHRILQQGQREANTHSRAMMDSRNWTGHHVG